MGAPPSITMSRGRRIDLSGPHYYQDLLTGIAMEILNELSELDKLALYMGAGTGGAAGTGSRLRVELADVEAALRLKPDDTEALVEEILDFGLRGVARPELLQAMNREAEPDGPRFFVGPN